MGTGVAEGGDADLGPARLLFFSLLQLFPDSFFYVVPPVARGRKYPVVFFSIRIPAYLFRTKD